MPSCRIRNAPAASACLLGALGLQTRLAPDHIIGAESALARISFSSVTDGISAVLSTTAESADGQVLPLGHQGRETAHPRGCPALADDGVGTAPNSQLRLSACAMPMDSLGRVLLTRRNSSMRTFPGCWVMPGGAVDPEDTSVAQTALRELEEETGIRATEDACEPPLCLWESTYPVSFDGWRRARESGARVSHYLVAFIVVRVDCEQPLKLSPDECDAACWVPLDEVAGALCEGTGAMEGAFPHAPLVVSTTADAATAAAPTIEPVSRAQLAGVYPNAAAEGIGRGHLFALRTLLSASQQ